MSNIHLISQAGQSIWMDHIQRSFLAFGELERWIELGITGVTSNPTILQQAIAGGTDYESSLQRLAASDVSVLEAYESLAIADIQAAADLLRPTYDRSGGKDGYVSLEVDPRLAMDADATIAQAKRLFKRIGRPNAMIKVPATAAGCRALERLIGEGINVNVTLIFSVGRYANVLDAFQRGLEKRIERGEPISKIASVASFFVSRIDSAVDPLLEERHATELLGQTAIASAALVYDTFERSLSSPRWKGLAAAGAYPQRPLWASTSTKNPAYPDTLYVDSLIAPETVNTVPLKTLNAVLDHGQADGSRLPDADGAQSILTRLAQRDVDLAAVTDELLTQGLDKFEASFVALIGKIAGRLAEYGRITHDPVHLEIDACEDHRKLTAALERLDEEHVTERIWNHDFTLWSSSASEIEDRLDWLHTPQTYTDQIDALHRFAQTLREDGIRTAVLLGMGGSSLAANVFRQSFGVQAEGIPLQVIDTTHPDAIHTVIDPLDPQTTLFIVATKSGTTIETLSLFRSCYNRARRVLPFSECGQRFVAITDPGSPLTALAEQLAFRKIFLNAPNLGGRYSALSFFGLVPASILGINIGELLATAQTMAEACAMELCAASNPGARLGAVLGALAAEGRDKLTVLPSSALPEFDAWLEQLIAESTGKEGTGIIPVVGEPDLERSSYGHDRLFVEIEAGRDPVAQLRTRSRDLANDGHPLIRIRARDPRDLGGLFILWEFATAVAGHILGIHPFNQPDVEASKHRARQRVAAFREQGRAPLLEQEPNSKETAAEQLASFLKSIPVNGYAAIQAYIPASPEADALLANLRAVIARNAHCATTAGYGPRFLHSTGQLHKGGPRSGRFLQLLSLPENDLAIPDKAGSEQTSLTFASLLAAQATGDREAIEDAGRSVVSLMLGDRPAEALRTLLARI